MDKTFDTLRKMLSKYESKLAIVKDEPTNYYLNTPIPEGKKKGEFFAAVQMKKSYVAYHLMPVYYNPDLLSTISEDLKKRMQGKSCFNFKSDDTALFKELTSLTKVAFDYYKKEGKV